MILSFQCYVSLVAPTLPRLADMWALAYGSAVFLLLAGSSLSGTTRQKVVCSALVLLWISNYAYTEITNNMTPEWFFGTGDFIAGSIVFLTAGSNKWQRAVGTWFLAMMAAHIAFWFFEPQTFTVQYAYWVSLTVFGWLQLLTVVMWLYGRLMADSIVRGLTLAVSKR